MKKIKLFTLLIAKQLATFLLITFLLIGCKPPSSPASDFKVNVTGETITEYIGNDIEVVIPSEIYGEKITTIGYCAFQNKEVINVTIPHGITNIGNFSFCGSKTRKINIPNTVTTIGEYAFCDCKGLKEIILPNSLLTIGKNAFANCTNLKSILIPSSLSKIGSQSFSGCNNLLSIEVESENTKYCSVDGILFNKDKTIIIQYPSKKENNNYHIPNTVVNIASYAFSNSRNLSSVEIPITITDIGDHAFEYSELLNNITIPINTKYIGECAFGNCSSLKNIRFEAEIPLKIDYSIFGLSTESSDSIYIEVPKVSLKSYNDSWEFWIRIKYKLIGY